MGTQFYFRYNAALVRSLRILHPIKGRVHTPQSGALEVMRRKEGVMSRISPRLAFPLPPLSEKLACKLFSRGTGQQT